MISCNRDSDFCMALNLAEDQINDINTKCWINKDAVSQRNFIILIDVKTPERRRPNQGQKEGPRKKKTVSYFIPTVQGNIPVCRATFLSILNVGRRKVEHAADEKTLHNKAVPETRG